MAVGRNEQNEKAAQCAASKVVGPHGPPNCGPKDYELTRNAASPVKSCVAWRRYS